MSERVSTFWDLKIGKARYHFFVITWTDYVTAVSEEINRQFDAFGENLGPDGKVIQAYKSAKRDSFNEVMSKGWPNEIGERLNQEQDPFMLIINKDFAEFNPNLDSWGVIWFSNFYDRPQAIPRLFGKLAMKTQKGEDLFSYLNTLSRKEKFKKFGKYFDLKKPEVFGISIDVEAILEDIIAR